MGIVFLLFGFGTWILIKSNYSRNKGIDIVSSDSILLFSDGCIGILFGGILLAIAYGMRFYYTYGIFP